MGDGAWSAVSGPTVTPLPAASNPAGLASGTRTTALRGRPGRVRRFMPPAGCKKRLTPGRPLSVRSCAAGPAALVALDLLLPDRGLRLHAVDDLAGARERLAAVRRRHRHD